MKNIRKLDEGEFYNYILNEYENSPDYESDELKDPRFYEGTYYSYVCKTRCYLVYREIISRLHNGAKIIDFGCYPGTLIKVLKKLLGDNISCYGLGQGIDPKFEKYLSPYVDGIVNAELDPFYLDSGMEVKIPFEDESFDAVVATEIFEHLISPLEMISEGGRILKKGGYYIITTPNVHHIGAVLRLMLCKSNYERLDRSPMYLQNDPWRGHIRFYTKEELKTLYERAGLELIYHKYYQERGWEHAKWPLIKRVINRFVDIFMPFYRESHFAVFQKK